MTRAWIARLIPAAIAGLVFGWMWAERREVDELRAELDRLRADAWAQRESEGGGS